MSPISAAVIGVAANIACQCASINPGIMVCPGQSTSRAPAGVLSSAFAGAIVSIRPFATTTCAGSPTVPARLSNTRTPRRIVTVFAAVVKA